MPLPEITYCLRSTFRRSPRLLSLVLLSGSGRWATWITRRSSPLLLFLRRLSVRRRLSPILLSPVLRSINPLSPGSTRLAKTHDTAKIHRAIAHLQPLQHPPINTENVTKSQIQRGFTMKTTVQNYFLILSTMIWREKEEILRRFVDTYWQSPRNLKRHSGNGSNLYLWLNANGCARPGRSFSTYLSKCNKWRPQLPQKLLQVALC